MLASPLASVADAPRGEVATTMFLIPQVGISYTAYLPPDDPRVGRPVVETRIYLTVLSFTGSDAANFATDLGFPIEPDPGNENVFFVLGADLGWSGAGLFEHYEATQRFNGHFISRLYGAETPNENFAGRIMEGSRIEVDYLPAPSFALGDMNCDGVVSVGDIGPFVLALSDPDGYVSRYPNCDMLNGDLNGDGQLSVVDIGPFVILLAG